MTIDSTCSERTTRTTGTYAVVPDPLRTTASTGHSPDAGTLDVDAWEGWQALAVATLGRQLTRAEHAAVQALSTEHALDLLFPDLPDAAREEALWALG
jgi:hypothetical protein